MQIVYARTMEIVLTVMLAFVGFASCAIVMIRMWGPEALAFRRRSREDAKVSGGYGVAAASHASEVFGHGSFHGLSTGTRAFR